ncbi:hypothetical protein HYH03_012119 [Edaphochlamys debaryana]|uniref:SET domain-containing protein n=1 Tax=Edaphochlamys debaryana TaxID=47281 RepID=A0A835XSL7_9CHLO|nr:hypothetical protein HYH03_012119 [Edaphochlamys debaryana]|eukprot:KAG2489483.1 hypothetical protein HYH03_012119 [Edaphochlamys debaryana]
MRPASEREGTVAPRPQRPASPAWAEALPRRERPRPKLRRLADLIASCPRVGGSARDGGSTAPLGRSGAAHGTAAAGTSCRGALAAASLPSPQGPPLRGAQQQGQTLGVLGPQGSVRPGQAPLPATPPLRPPPPPPRAPASGSPEPPGLGPFPTAAQVGSGGARIPVYMWLDEDTLCYGDVCLPLHTVACVLGPHTAQHGLPPPGLPLLPAREKGDPRPPPGPLPGAWLRSRPCRTAPAGAGPAWQLVGLWEWLRRSGAASGDMLVLEAEEADVPPSMGAAACLSGRRVMAVSVRLLKPAGTAPVSEHAEDSLQEDAAAAVEEAAAEVMEAAPSGPVVRSTRGGIQAARGQGAASLGGATVSGQLPFWRALLGGGGSGPCLGSGSELEPSAYEPSPSSASSAGDLEDESPPERAAARRGASAMQGAIRSSAWGQPPADIGAHDARSGLGGAGGVAGSRGDGRVADPSSDDRRGGGGRAAGQAEREDADGAAAVAAVYPLRLSGSSLYCQKASLHHAFPAELRALRDSGAAQPVQLYGRMPYGCVRLYDGVRLTRSCHGINVSYKIISHNALLRDVAGGKDRVASSPFRLAVLEDGRAVVEAGEATEPEPRILPASAFDSSRIVVVPFETLPQLLGLTAEQLAGTEGHLQLRVRASVVGSPGAEELGGVYLALHSRSWVLRGLRPWLLRSGAAVGDLLALRRAEEPPPAADAGTAGAGPSTAAPTADRGIVPAITVRLFRTGARGAAAAVQQAAEALSPEQAAHDGDRVASTPFRLAVLEDGRAVVEAGEATEPEPRVLQATALRKGFIGVSFETLHGLLGLTREQLAGTEGHLQLRVRASVVGSPGAEELGGVYLALHSRSWVLRGLHRWLKRSGAAVGDLLALGRAQAPPPAPGADAGAGPSTAGAAADGGSQPGPSQQPPAPSCTGLPAASISRLQGYVPPGELPPLRPGELRLCGLTFHPAVAPAIRAALEQWEAAQPGAPDPAAERIAVQAGPEAAGAPGLDPLVLFTSLADLLGLTAPGAAGRPLPEGPVDCGLVAPCGDPAQGHSGLRATARIAAGSAVCVVGGYVLPRGAAEELVASGLSQCRPEVRAQVAAALEDAGTGGGSTASLQAAWRLMVGSLTLPYTLPYGMDERRGGAEEAATSGPSDPLRLSQLGYGGLGALVCDFRTQTTGGEVEGDASPLPMQGPNCTILSVSVRGVCLPVLVALRDIAPGERLLRDYGEGWWRDMDVAWEAAEREGVALQALL